MKAYLVIIHILDFAIALIAFLVQSTLISITLVTMLVVKQGSAFLLQERPRGLNKLFKIIKFKTIRDRKPAEDGHNVNSVTKLGGINRKYSLDEIPQLFNVLKGDMSLIGPRPLIITYLPIYNEEQKKHQNIRPGITSWAQVNGRNTISWNKKFEFDVWYVKNLSLGLDFKILFLTVIKVLQKKDVNLSKDLTSEYFNGTN